MRELTIQRFEKLKDIYCQPCICVILGNYVTTQDAPDSESTCGTAVCVVSLNTNLSNFPNRAG